MATISDLSSGATNFGLSNPSQGVQDYTKMFGDASFGSMVHRLIMPSYYDQTRQEYMSALDREYNAEQAEIARRFASTEAERDRQFQERLSSTAYQRAVEDMKKAGINPVIAFAQNASPASTPQGAFASSSQASSRSRSSDKGGTILSRLILSIVSGLLQGVGGKHFKVGF